jgi:glycosyltransferase involved in cell wall biosynthesis
LFGIKLVNMAKISVVVNTLNEEKNLPRALSSIKTIADEIVVVDMKSIDNTVGIAKEFGAKVYEHERTNYVEPARNYALSKAKNKWILVLDADERVPAKLTKKLKQISKSPDADYYRIPRKNIVFGKWLKHSRWWPDYNIRFFKKGAVAWNEVIHSVPMTTGKGKDLPDLKDYAIVHYHYNNIEQYITRMNRYTTVQAKIKRKDGYKFSWRDLISKPSGEFLSRYFFAEGYKDGIHGLALSGLQAFSEMVLYLKLWQSEDFKTERPVTQDVLNEMKKVESEFRYWQADVLVKNGGGTIARLKRKFRLP